MPHSWFVLFVYFLCSGRDGGESQVAAEKNLNADSMNLQTDKQNK